MELKTGSSSTEAILEQGVCDRYGYITYINPTRQWAVVEIDGRPPIKFHLHKDSFRPEGDWEGVERGTEVVFSAHGRQLVTEGHKPRVSKARLAANG